MDETLTAVSNMQKYIAENIEKPITLAELARAANYSIYHTERIFKRYIGMTPFDYIRKMRLTNAAKKLKDNPDCAVLDVALDYLFDTHEGFTRAFTKEFCISPYRYKKDAPPIKYFIAYDALAASSINKETKSKMETKIIFTQIIERPKRKAIIKRGIKANEYFEYCGEVGCDVWGVLTSVKEALFEPAGFWLPQKLRHGKSEYVQGVEVPDTYCGQVPDGYELIDLPPCRYMVFQGEPYDDKDFCEAIVAVQKAIGNYKIETTGYTWDNENPRFQYAPMGERGYIEALAIKKL